MPAKTGKCSLNLVIESIELIILTDANQEFLRMQPIQSFWWRAFSQLAPIFIISIMLTIAMGIMSGLICLVIGLLFLQARHFYNLYTLNRWLSAAGTRPVPQGRGLWEGLFNALYSLFKRQSQSREQLNLMLERFRDAAKAMPDGVVILNENDLIEWCNPIAEHHLGLDSQHDMGYPINYLIRQTQFNEYLARQLYHEPLPLKSVRNPDIFLSIQLIPFGDKQKLLISRDVSQLERVEVMRRDFVANVSHELRTPLTVINGFLETFMGMNYSNSAEVQHYISLMHEQAQRMKRLVEALLVLSRLESVQNLISKEPVPCRPLMQLLFKEALTLSAGHHHIRLEIRSDADAWGSEDELRSAFSNLITNAVRYTPEGGDITLIWESTSTEGMFRVEDTGIGVSPEHINRLTERFYRVDKSRSRETGGTGLGLSIVKHVMTRHQGRLEIISTKGKGSTFSAIIPLSPLEEQISTPPSIPDYLPDRKPNEDAVAPPRQAEENVDLQQNAE